jgi:regulatory protein
VSRAAPRGLAGSRLGKGARPPADAEAAYAAAVRILARQAQSRAGLQARLGRAGYTDDAARAAADRAVEHGFLDDQEYARGLVRRRSAGRGQALIAQELRAKGIDDVTVSDALDQVSDDAEYGRALSLARRIVGSRRPTGYQELLAMVGPKLSRRGFSSGIIHRVRRELSAEWAAAPRFDTPSEHN